MVKDDVKVSGESRRKRGAASRWLAVWMAAALALVGSFVAPLPASAAPTFKAPFRCGEVWTASTYDGHGHAADLATYSGGANVSNGRPVLASADGRVIHSLVDSIGGEMVRVQHGSTGWSTYYGHLSSRAVSQGQEVKAGDVLGYVGNTGYVDPKSFYHLHYEQENPVGGAAMPVAFDGVKIGLRWGGGSPSAPAFTSTNGCESVVASAITWEAPTGWHADQKITFDFTVTNKSSKSVPMALLGLGARDSQGRNVDRWCAKDITVPAGGQYRCRMSTSWPSTGAHQYWVSWMTPDGNWHSSKPAVSGSFTLAEKMPVEILKPLEVKLPAGSYVWSPVTKAFSVKNTSSKPVKMDLLILAVRDPHGSNYDRACARDLILAPGATHECFFENGWGSVGTYRVWPSYYMNNTWHSPQAQQTFALGAAPGGISVTKALEIKAPEGWETGKPVKLTMSAVNASDKPLYLEYLIAATRDPNGRNVDQVCAQKITLAPREARDCSITAKWSTPGRYTTWVAWSPEGSTWHQRYGAEQSFEITKAPEPKLLTATPVPVVAGSVKVGKTLTADAGAWGPGEVSLSYQWFRSGKAIAKATSSTYTLVAADKGATISVTVTGKKSGYTTVTKTSKVTKKVAAGTLSATPVPKISGTVKVGKKLTVKPGSWKPASVTLSYQWLRNGKAIKGATKSTYKLAKADKGKKITVRVTGKKSGYTTVSKTSKATKKVS